MADLKLFSLEYCRLDRASELLGCKVSDLIHLGSTYRIDICLFMNNVLGHLHFREPDKELLRILLTRNLGDFNENSSFYPHNNVWSVDPDGVNFDDLNYIVDSDTGLSSIEGGAFGLWAITPEKLRELEFNNSIFIDEQTLFVYPENYYDISDDFPSIGFMPKSTNNIVIRNNEFIYPDDLFISIDQIKKITDSLEKGVSLIRRYKKSRLMEEEKTVGQSKSKKTANSQAKFIKALLYLCYKDEELINNPRKYIDSSNSEIRNDFDSLGLTLPTGKTIENWLKNIDLDIL